jgi:hypothetical protein
LGTEVPKAAPSPNQHPNKNLYVNNCHAFNS